MQFSIKTAYTVHRVEIINDEEGSFAQLIEDIKELQGTTHPIFSAKTHVDGSVTGFLSCFDLIVRAHELRSQQELRNHVTEDHNFIKSIVDHFSTVTDRDSIMLELMLK